MIRRNTSFINLYVFIMEISTEHVVFTYRELVGCSHYYTEVLIMYTLSCSFVISCANNQGIELHLLWLTTTYTNMKICHFSRYMTKSKTMHLTCHYYQ